MPKSFVWPQCDSSGRVEFPLPGMQPCLTYETIRSFLGGYSGGNGSVV